MFKAMLTADELERYARHIVLPEVGGPGQALGNGLTLAFRDTRHPDWTASAPDYPQASAVDWPGSPAPAVDWAGSSAPAALLPKDPPPIAPRPVSRDEWL